MAEGPVERISSEIDKQVDARLDSVASSPPSSSAGPSRANLAVGLGSVGLGIGATAVILQSWPTSGAALKAVLDLGSFRASLMTSIKSGEHGPGSPHDADLGRHCCHQHRLRPAPSRSALSCAPPRRDRFEQANRPTGGRDLPVPSLFRQSVERRRN